MAKPRDSLPLESETAWYVLLNVCDIVATYALLRRDSRFIESNPIARWFYHGWGFTGMVWFKLGIVAFVVLLAHIVGRKNPRLAQAVLMFGCVAVGCVFIYSYWLGTHS